MRAKLPSRVVKNILEAAKNAYDARLPGFTERLELGRRLFTAWHCGTRMVQVKAFTKQDENLPFEETNERRLVDAAVCPFCMKTIVFLNLDM